MARWARRRGREKASERKMAAERERVADSDDGQQQITTITTQNTG
jgi:hypothetical protein